jgi:hypothetical protein
LRQPVIVGCDPSSKKLAFFAIHPLTRTVMARAFVLRGNARYTPEGAAEAGHACAEMLTLINPMGTPSTPMILFIEEPVVGRGGIRSSLVQAYINGVVQDWFTRAGYSVRITHQSTWKSGLGIPQRGGKPEVLAAMKRLYPKDVRACGPDEDLLDAAALARYGVEAIRRGG